MSRNLVIGCDGTGNQFGSKNTSVVRLVQVAKRDYETQRVSERLVPDFLNSLRLSSKGEPG